MNQGSAGKDRGRNRKAWRARNQFHLPLSEGFDRAGMISFRRIRMKMPMKHRAGSQRLKEQQEQNQTAGDRGLRSRKDLSQTDVHTALIAKPGPAQAQGFNTTLSHQLICHGSSWQRVRIPGEKIVPPGKAFIAL